MACRLPDGTIDVETEDIKNGKDAPWYKKAPFIRGCFNFIGSLISGSKSIMRSGEKQLTEEDEEEPSRFEKWLIEKFGDKLMPILSVVIIIFSFAISLGLFKFLPMGVSTLIGFIGAPAWLKAVVGE